MPYNPNNPSNWSWSKAFDEMAKTVHQAEITAQIVNHLADYPGNSDGEYVKLSKEDQDNLYVILSQIL